jgi:transposase
MTDPEVKMTIKTLARKGVARREIARQLELNEATVRYHLRRMANGTEDGRSRQRRLAADFDAWIENWRESMGSVANSTALHEWLVTECGYPGSLRSLQRYLAERYPAPKLRTRRRVETPPGAQAQIDWAHFPGVPVAGTTANLSAFVLTLSYSRQYAVVWAASQSQIHWLECHNRAFARIQGVPAVARIDNVKTAVVHGSGPWGRLNECYRRYAQTMRFHIDVCLPREPRAKGKVERNVRTIRGILDPASQHWESLEQLQAYTDLQVAFSNQRRRCPATGTSVVAAWEAERRHLAPLPPMPEPFDTIASRTVGEDCMVAFEGRQYSVPFAYARATVEIRGTAGRVQVWRGRDLVASHERGTAQRIVIDTSHFEGPATATVLPPMPLGRMGRCLERLGEMPVTHRPTDLYAAIAEELAR